MDESLLRLIMPALSARRSPQAQGGEDSDFLLILPLILLIMADRKDFFLALALLSILSS